MKTKFYILILFSLILSSCSTKAAIPTREDEHIAMLIHKRQKPAKKPTKQKKQEKRSVIVIDAGHGGEDFGTHSVNPIKYHEKYLTLSTAMMLNNMLHQMGYQTVMTRNSDVFIPLKERAKIANGGNTELFVSVHYNSAPSRKAKGVEVFFYDAEDKSERTKESKALAQEVLDGIISSTEAKSRGVKNGNFLVIRETTMPAILVEGGFLTNESEMDQIKNAAYLKKVAWGIAEGIRNYFLGKTP